MPAMIRKLADFAEYKNKLRIEVHAPADESISEHQAKPEVHELISGGWDHVVLQAQSTEQIDKPNWGKWWQPATDLIKEVQQSGAKPWMFVTWRYTDRCSDERKWDEPANEAMHTAIQQQHAHLSRTTGVDLVNVGVVWNMLLRKEPEFSLYTDCNHPSIYGSYLSALMFYNEVLGGDIAKVTYRPDGIKADEAEVLKAAVVSFAQSADAPEVDKTGKGAVLCMWSIYVSVQQGIELCGLGALPSDAVLAQSITRIEQFTLENTTAGISAGDLRDHKADTYRQTQNMIEAGSRGAICDDIGLFRDRLSSNYRQNTDHLLSVKREPLWNPCI